MALVRNVSWLFYFVLFAFVLNGCLLADKAKKELSSSSGPSWFEGVSKVTNKAGSPPSVKIEWPKAERSVTGYRVYALMENPDTRVNEWQVLDETTSEQFSYTHSNVTSGKVYAYRVKALDDAGEEDSNTKQMSTVVFEGIANVRITGKTTATVTLNSSLGSFDEVRIYATPKRAGGTKQLVATASGNVQSISVSGLKSGMTYKFSASAYMSYLNAEDGNDFTIEGQTFSESFGSGSNSDNDYAYRGVFSFVGFGDAPNEEVGPSLRQLQLSWLGFANAGTNSKYRVIRTTSGTVLDTTASQLCTSSISNSCIVCEVTGPGPQTCTDQNVAPPPKKYDYAIALVKHDPVNGESWVEELPKDNAADFKIVGHVPPDYMVLIQRDAANYEMCSVMQRSSNPRKKQRCQYQGIGAAPYNTGPTKSPLTFEYGYYDFGYNMFVDRHKLACNWTRTSCGPNGCVGDTTSYSGPIIPSAPTSPGNDGDVYFALNYSYGHNCYLRKSGSWLASNNATLSDADIRTAVTVDPGPSGMKHRPAIQSVSPSEAFRMCNAVSTPYGRKRLLRRREDVIMHALPSFDGEPNAISDLRTRISIERNFVGISNAECAVDSGVPHEPRPANLAQLLSPTNKRSNMTASDGANLNTFVLYFIGTTATANCRTRWGNQDFNNRDNFGVNERTGYWLSDSFTRVSLSASDPISLISEVSELDAGSRDFLTYKIDGLIGPNYGKNTPDRRQYSFTPTDPLVGNSYILPLGVPILNWTGAPQDSWTIWNLYVRSFFGYRNIDGSANDYIKVDSNANTRFYILSGNRGRAGFTYAADQGIAGATIQCAQEAE